MSNVSEWTAWSAIFIFFRTSSPTTTARDLTLGVAPICVGRPEGIEPAVARS